MLSDVGGIQGILVSIFSLILTLFNYKHFDAFMASKLYKIKKTDANEDKYNSYFDRSNFFKPSKVSNLRHYMMDTLPSKCVCCKLSR